jgi:hypothetical protein
VFHGVVSNFGPNHRSNLIDVEDYYFEVSNIIYGRSYEFELTPKFRFLRQSQGNIGEAVNNAVESWLS